jgi:hypothetical protein
LNVSKILRVLNSNYCDVFAWYERFKVVNEGKSALGRDC